MKDSPDRPEPLTDPKGLVTYSVRFTEEQRTLIQRAANLRGWTPTHLLRTAALERAIHIINTGTPTRLDFRGLAVDVANRVARQPQVLFAADVEGVKYAATVVDDVLEPGSSRDDATDVVVELDPKPFGREELQRLEQASKFGGAEFLALLIEACNSVSGPHRYDLPDPIDPGKVAE